MRQRQPDDDRNQDDDIFEHLHEWPPTAANRPSHGLWLLSTQSRQRGYLTRSAFTIFTGGSRIWPFITPSPLVSETGDAKIFFTTSMPSVTWPNTAKPSGSPPGAPASKPGVSLSRMKKSA